MKKSNFLSKFVVACFGISVFGASMQPAFCIDDTPISDIKNEKDFVFVNSNVEYKIIKPNVSDVSGEIHAISFLDKSIVLSRNLTCSIGDEPYSYILTEVSLDDKSVDAEYLRLENFTGINISSLNIADFSGLKAIYVANGSKDSYISAVKEHFKDIPVYVVPSESTEATDLGTKELNFDKDNNEVVLNWSEISGANNYVITKSEIDTDEIIDVIISENDYETEDENSKRQYNYVDSDLAAGKTYQYRVSAYAGSGQKDDLFKTELAFFTTNAVSVPEKTVGSTTKPGNLISNSGSIRPNYSLDVNENLNSENINNSQNQNNVSDNTEINEDNLSENNKVNSKLESYKTGDNSHVVLFFCFINFILFCVFVITCKKRI